MVFKKIMSLSQPCLRARAGYYLDGSPAHGQGRAGQGRAGQGRAFTSEQCGVQCLAQGHFDMHLPGAGI